MKFRNANQVGKGTYSFAIENVKYWSSDTPKSGVVHITIDWSRIARELARKASNNKSNQTRDMGGAIVGKFVEVIDKAEAA